MTKNEFMTQIEALVGQLATTASPSQDKQQVQLLREDLLKKAYEIIGKKLTQKIAYQVADQLLNKARMELRQRQKAATQAGAATATKAPVAGELAIDPLPLKPGGRTLS
jgi:type II secretory pathway component PulJ